MKTLKISLFTVVVVMMGLISCGKEEVPAPPPTPSVTITDSIEIPFSTNHYTFYNMKDSSVVDISDSATTQWDFAIRFVNIIVNSHASGPGNGGVITQTGIFDNYTMAPATGFAYDTTTTNLAIDAGLTTGWYNYDDATHAFSPKAGQFFVIRTADGHYAKLEILSVTYAGYTPPNPTPTTLIYKFRYTYQPDGSGNF
ncbi:MAG TPA: HmuY family protein [Hanamia sp.]|nr:HmuY family protein [Hanamia sp.]